MSASVPLQFNSEIPTLDSEASAVIHTLTYFSLFRHPLRQEELVEYMQFCHAPIKDLAGTLAKLVEMNLIGCLTGYYFLAGREQHVEVRVDRNQRAELWNKKLARSVRLLTHLPFVEGVALTGSLSKGTQDPDGDMDFMLLARPGRMWTPFLFLRILLKPLPKFVAKLFCANMILPTDHLSIRAKNLFTASEIVTLWPLTNGELWQQFYNKNAWVKHFYPDWAPRQKTTHGELVKPAVRGWLDRVLSGKFGDWIEAAFANWMTRRIRRQEEAKSKSDPHLRRMWLDSVEIGHAEQRQTKLQSAWDAALAKFESTNCVRLLRWQWELGNRDEIRTISFGRGPSRSLFPQGRSYPRGQTGPLPSGD